MTSTYNETCPEASLTVLASGDQSCLRDHGAFVGFPPKTLLEASALPIADLAALALREGQCSNDLSRLHRWFARRVNSQFRSLLTALSLKPEEGQAFWPTYFGDISLDGAVVLDPFVGGGTSLVEASRCGARILGYDVDPVATSISRLTLRAASYSADILDTDELWDGIAQRVLPFHNTRVATGGGDASATVPVLHHFWVEVVECAKCGHHVDVHPHYRLAHDKEKGKQWAFCRLCGAVHELPLLAENLTCSCGERTEIQRGPYLKGDVICSACSHVQPLSEREVAAGSPPRWRLFAQEYIVPAKRGWARHFKTATLEDMRLYDSAAAAYRALETAGAATVPARSIPREGRSSQRPLIHGITRYRDLFNERQLLHLSLLGSAIIELTDASQRHLLGLAFSEHLATNCMYTAYAFGYRRTSPMFSIHGYRHITRPVELNPWLCGIGRGTFPNVLGKVRRAIAFARAPSDLDPQGGRRPHRRPIGPSDGVVGTCPRDVIASKVSAAIATASSEDLGAIPPASVDLILTDPPYFDNISYSELSDFYLAWHQVLGIAEPPYDTTRMSAPLRANLALTNRSEEAVDEYGRRLRSIFAEFRRVLKPNGICVFTYHHASLKAWHALGEAIATAGLACTAVLPLRGEGQGGLHTQEGTIKWDATLVCRPVAMDVVAADSSVVVPAHEIVCAAEQTRAYARLLGNDVRIGFRQPDRINLFRAFIVAAATVGTPGGERVPLASALSTGYTE